MPVNKRQFVPRQWALLLLAVLGSSCESRTRGFAPVPEAGARHDGGQADSSSELEDARAPSDLDARADAADTGLADTGLADASVADGGLLDSGLLDSGLPPGPDAAEPDAAEPANTAAMPSVSTAVIPESSTDATVPPEPDAGENSPDAHVPDLCAVGTVQTCGGCGLETCDEEGEWSDCVQQQAPTCQNAETALTCVGGLWDVEACTGSTECVTGSCLNVFHGDVVLLTASDVATYSGYDVIDGDLLVDIPADFGSTVELPSLKLVRGDVSLVYNGIEHPTNVVETRCGISGEVVSYFAPINLTSLSAVEGNLTLRQKGYFKYPFQGGFGTARFDFGLSALSTLGGDLSMKVELAGASACGIPHLARVPGHVTLDYGGHDLATAGDPLLPALTEIAGTLEIKGLGYGGSCPEAFPALWYAGGLSLTNDSVGSGTVRFPLLSLTDVGVATLRGPTTQDSAESLLRIGHLYLNGPPDLERIGGATLALGALTIENTYWIPHVGTTSKVTLSASAEVHVTQTSPTTHEDICWFIDYHHAHGWLEELYLDGLVVTCP